MFTFTIATIWYFGYGLYYTWMLKYTDPNFIEDTEKKSRKQNALDIWIWTPFWPINLYRYGF